MFAACRRAGLLPLLVAANLTYAIQPIDFRAFHLFKTHVQKAYQVFRLQSAGVSLRDWLASICTAIIVVLRGRSWARAFDSAGFGANQTWLGDQTIAPL